VEINSRSNPLSVWKFVTAAIGNDTELALILPVLSQTFRWQGSQRQPWGLTPCMGGRVNFGGPNRHWNNLWWTTQVPP
jgi:hypothetical protein